MGHYYGDLMCDGCGEIRCICERIAASERTMYVVTNDFEVCTTEEFLVANGSESTARMRLMFKDKFDTREQAEENARIICERAVEAARADLLRLKKICVTIRPWEKKSK